MNYLCPREGCDYVVHGVFDARSHALDHERWDREAENALEETSGDELADEIQKWLRGRDT